MTRLRLYVLPRLCLGLSVLFFLFALWVLWLSLERPMPTVALACRQAERAGLSSSGTLLASGSAEPGQTGAHHDRHFQGHRLHTLLRTIPTLRTRLGSCLIAVSAGSKTKYQGQRQHRADHFFHL